MAQNFVGKNNITLLCPCGMYRTREEGVDDHADGRYLSTFLSPIWQHIFLKEDELILKYLNDDNGQSIEPMWYLPVIPMILVNGCTGIATGWSTKVPNFKLEQIIVNLKRLLEDKEDLEAMQPWYNGFKGDIMPDDTTNSYITKGKVEEKVGETNKVIIKELPIGKWTLKYRKFLDSAAFIEKYDSHNDADDDGEINFEIVMPVNQVDEALRHEWLLDKLKLTTNLPMSNMYLFDADGIIKNYDNADRILREFYDFRLQYYVHRKVAVLAELKKDLEHLENYFKLRSSTVKLSEDELEAERKKK